MAYLFWMFASALTTFIQTSGQLILPKMNFTDLAELNGLNADTHNVITKDGYILTMFHIKSNGSNPILLVHGIMNCADNWILRGDKSMVVYLKKAGYDVWVANVRGTPYSRRHITLDSDRDPRFWDFSFHEMGYYDLPAMIDYILDYYQYSSVTVIAHSQGNQIAYVMGATKPQYNKKVKLLIALAPISFLQNVRGAAKTIFNLEPIIRPIFKILGIVEIFDDRGIIRQIQQRFCAISDLGYDICGNLFTFALDGYDGEEIEEEFYRTTLVPYSPRSTSTKNIYHLAQLYHRRIFSPYSYGVIKNVFIYGSLYPQPYDLSQVTMKVALLSGENDPLATIPDVELLRARLPNVVLNTNITRKEWTHIDFLYAKHLDQFLYPVIGDLLFEYDGHYHYTLNQNVPHE